NAASRATSVGCVQAGTALVRAVRQLGELGNELCKFGLRPGSDHAATDIALRADRQQEFGDVVAVGSLHDDKEVTVAACEVGVRDFGSHFLGKFPSGLPALGSILDRANSLFSPAEGTYERRHFGPPLHHGT